MRTYSLSLSEDERNALVNILEEVLKTTQVEEHRTDRFRAKKVVHAREVLIESLLKKARGAKSN
jgi:hypothetical protein